MGLPRTVDVAIVGAGTSGAAAARYLAERGARVLCLERRHLDEAGARWVNGITRAALTEAEIDLPPSARIGGPHPMHMLTASGRLLVREHDVIDVDMRALVALLQEQARSAGATLVGDISVLGRDRDRLRTDRGDVQARWIVDASGLSGARLLGQPTVPQRHLCAAAQAVFQIRDHDGARAFFDRVGVPPGEVYSRLGVAGGFSTLSVCLNDSGNTIGVLAGSIPALGYPAGKTLLEQFVRSEPWIGARVFGGQGAIPLRRPYDRLARGNVALIGDAACQVFPAHGSGIGAGILAAKLLAETLAACRPLRDYEVAWHRRWGGLFAAYDAFRRWNQTMDPELLDELMAGGLLDAVTARAGLDQTMPSISLATIPPKARALRQRPRLLSGMIRLAAQVGIVQLLAAFYPRSEAGWLTAWRATMASILDV